VPRYQLRTLLILLATGPPLLAVFIAMAVELCTRWVISTHSDSSADYSFLCAAIPPTLTIASFFSKP